MLSPRKASPAASLAAEIRKRAKPRSTRASEDRRLSSDPQPSAASLARHPKMNFAPYQDESPEIERALSPALSDANRPKTSPHLGSPRASPPTASAGFPAAGLPSPSHFGGIGAGGHGFTGFGRDVESGRLSLGAFETSLPLRMDYEAMLAYLLLPPAGGVFLLLFEHKSDYVRYVQSNGWPAVLGIEGKLN
ncbi:hypothetical protein VTN02DRAFT_5254 [Thermoascus thermophilus]